MKLSVGIPFHDCAPYLERCVRTLMEQTARDLEFIFVDDASTDDGAEIVRRIVSEYPERQDAVRLIAHTVSAGAFASRIEALKESNGDLIAFCDADDWLDLDYFECLSAAFTADDVEMVFAPMVRNEDELMRGERNLAFDGSGFDYLNAVGRIVAFNSMVNKAYRRAWLLERLPEVPEGIRIGEDSCFIAQLAGRCQHVKGVVGTRYHYRVNNLSVSRAFDAKGAVEDLRRVHAVIDRMLPKGETGVFRRHLLRELRFLGLKLGVTSRQECRAWLAAERALGRVDSPMSENVTRRLVLGASERSYALAYVISALVRLKGKGGI